MFAQNSAKGLSPLHCQTLPGITALAMLIPAVIMATLGGNRAQAAETQPVTLRFAARVGNQPFVCGTTYRLGQPASSNLSQNQAKTAPGCISEPNDRDCIGIMARLGIPFMGQPPSSQTFFRVE